MKIITPYLHGYLDYLTVVIFFLAPSVFGLDGLAGILAYLLAVVHLAMTIATDFPLGLIKLVPLRIHGWVERVVGPTLLILPWVLGFAGSALAFYIVIGIVIIAVGVLTDYAAPAWDGGPRVGGA